MEQIVFKRGAESIHQLEEIMCSYQGRAQGTLALDQKALVMLLILLERNEIVVTKHTYIFNPYIRDDDDIVPVYETLAAQTRWRRFERTEIEGIRMNALQQMRQEGIPFYDGYICYQNGQVQVHCGNLDPSELLTHLAEHEDLKYFYIFAYPYWTEEQTAAYYRFEFSAEAVAGAKAYHEMIWAAIRNAALSDVFPEEM